MDGDGARAAFDGRQLLFDPNRPGEFRASLLNELRYGRPTKAAIFELLYTRDCLYLRDDREVVLALADRFGRWNGEAVLCYASEGLRNDRRIVLAVVKEAGSSLQFASGELRANRRIVLAAVGTHGHALRYASVELKNDREVVLAAVGNDWRAFIHASDELKNDREVVLAAVGNSGLALQYAFDELKNDREVVLAAVGIAWSALQYASDELKNTREVVLATVGNNGVALQYASDELKNDKELVLVAVGNFGAALGYASDELRDDPVVAGKAICNGADLSHIGGALKGQILSVIGYLIEDSWHSTNAPPFFNAGGVLPYVKQRVHTLWENIWLLLKRSPAELGGGQFAKEINKEILESSDAGHEFRMMHLLEKCAPVIEGYAERGVAWAEIEYEDPTTYR